MNANVHRHDDDTEGNSAQEIAVPDQALVQAISKAELDQSITTARAFPRSVKAFKDECEELATLDDQTADECIYALPRREKDKQTGQWVTKNIEGPSARFAEIVLYSWGNCRGGARIVNEERDFITAQGIFHDLQKNTHITFEVRRRITTSEGRRYNSDMIGVTGNAASSIALRNAVLKGVPKALWNPAYLAARQVCVGDLKTLANYRGEAMKHLQKLGATPEMVFRTLGVKGLDDVGLEELAVLKGIANSIKEGEITVERAFAPVEDEATTTSSRGDAAKEALRRQQQSAGTAAQPKETEQPKTATPPADKQPEPDKPKPAAKGAKKPAEKSSELPFWSEESAIADLIKTTTVTACEELYDKICADLGPRHEGQVPEKVQSTYADWHAHLSEQV